LRVIADRSGLRAAADRGFERAMVLEKEARRDKRNVWFHVVNAFSLLIARMAPDAPKADGKILPDKDYDYRRW
jgi:hypothetical protein